MKRPLLLLILLLLLGSFAYWLLGNRATNVASHEKSEPSAEKAAPEPPSATVPLPVPATTKTALSPPQKTSGEDDPTGNRLRRAYMLSLDKGALTFLEQQDIEGDFAKPRRKPEEWSGMLRCRLMSDSNAVLAEELLPAPDHLCAVIDPKSGSDKPVQYTVAGPVVFQVRLPRVKGAARLDISRIIQPADSTQPGLEGQLGSIPLPRS